MENIQKLLDIKIEEKIIPFNPLHIAYEKIVRKEELLSKIIAGFLDPKENHKLGFTPINEFFKKIEIGQQLNKNSFLEIEIEKVIKETQRRIDIFIGWKDKNDGEKHAVIIENKLNYAPEQDNQLNDYYNYIEKTEKYKVEKVVFMPPVYCEPTTAGKIPKEKIKIIDLKGLADWANEIKEDNPTLVNFKEFIECLIEDFYIMKRMKEILEKLKTPEEIINFEKLVDFVSENWDKWVEVRFSSIIQKLPLDKFGVEVPLQFGNYRFAKDKSYCFINIYFFEENKGCCQLRMNGNNIEIFLFFKDEKQKEEIIKNDTKFERKESEDDGGNICFHYKNNFNLCDVDKLIKALIPILKKLSEYKFFYRELAYKLTNEYQKYNKYELINKETKVGLIIKTKRREKIELYIYEKEDGSMVIDGNLDKLTNPRKKPLKVTEGDAYDKLTKMIDDIVKK